MGFTAMSSASMWFCDRSANPRSFFATTVFRLSAATVPSPFRQTPAAKRNKTVIMIAAITFFTKQPPYKIRAAKYFLFEILQKAILYFKKQVLFLIMLNPETLC
jgi:hypothetical protein